VGEQDRATDLIGHATLGSLGNVVAKDVRLLAQLVIVALYELGNLVIDAVLNRLGVCTGSL
jgi:hypothetical protein